MKAKRQSIVVAIGDPTRKKQMALQKAATLAERTHARLTLLHTFAFPYPLAEPSPLDSKDIVDATKAIHRRNLMRLAKSLRTRDLEVDCVVEWDFPPHEAIVRYLRRHPCDLLIAESHRHGRIARWLLTNTDWQLIRECPCPLWFVKTPTLSPHPLVLAAVDPLHSHAKPSGLDDRILDAARQTARRLEGTVYLGHAYEIPLMLAPTTLPEPLLAPMPEEDVRRFKDLVDRKVTQLAAKYKIPTSRRLIRDGDTSEVLGSLVEELGADLVVMGAVSRRGADRVFIGNTAEKAIDRVNCDVLVVRPKNFRSRVPSRARR